MNNGPGLESLVFLLFWIHVAKLIFRTPFLFEHFPHSDGELAIYLGISEQSSTIDVLQGSKYAPATR